MLAVPSFDYAFSMGGLRQVLRESDPGWLREIVDGYFGFLASEEGFQITESTPYSVRLARLDLRAHFTWDWRDNAFQLRFGPANPDVEMLAFSPLIDYFEKPRFDYSEWRKKVDGPMGEQTDTMLEGSAKTRAFWGRIAAFFQTEGFEARLQDYERYWAEYLVEFKRQEDEYDREQGEEEEDEDAF